MSLTLNDVSRIANLAKLELSEEQQNNALHQLNNIFGMVEQMRAVNTEGIAPLSHPIAALMPELALRMRPDTVTEENRREAFQALAPATQDGLYLVPQVIE